MKGKPAYPLRHYLSNGVKVCINTDNSGISAATLTETRTKLTRTADNLVALACRRDRGHPPGIHEDPA